MAVCWLSARTCRGGACPARGRASARLFVLARHRFSFSRHSPLLFTIDGPPSGRRPVARLAKQPHPADWLASGRRFSLIELKVCAGRITG